MIEATKNKGMTATFDLISLAFAKNTSESETEVKLTMEFAHEKMMAILDAKET